MRYMHHGSRRLRYNNEADGLKGDCPFGDKKTAPGRWERESGHGDNQNKK